MSANLREPRLPRLDSCFIIVVIKTENNYDVSRIVGMKITKVRFILYHENKAEETNLPHNISNGVYEENKSPDVDLTHSVAKS